VIDDLLDFEPVWLSPIKPSFIVDQYLSVLTRPISDIHHVAL